MFMPPLGLASGQAAYLAPNLPTGRPALLTMYAWSCHVFNNTLLQVNCSL